jgi:hypothetical protein
MGHVGFQFCETPEYHRLCPLDCEGVWAVFRKLTNLKDPGDRTPLKRGND